MNRDEILAENPIADFVRSRGHKLMRAGENFVSGGCPQTQHKRGHCPVTINVAKQVWYCNDCKIGGSVIDWEAIEKKIEPAEAMRQLRGGRNGANPPGARPQIVATYDYCDEAGNLLFQCVRQEPKDFKQRRPDDTGGWIWNIQGVRRVLYHLPQVIAAQTICIAEGEKDCDNLAKLGFVTTTNVFGAGKWRDEYSEPLHGKDVIVFGDVGDDDGKGKKHTQQVIESLTGKAKSIKHPAMPEGFHDVSDFIKSFSSEAEAKTAIQKLIEQATSLGMVVAPASMGLHIRSEPSATSAIVTTLRERDRVFVDEGRLRNNRPPSPVDWQKVTSMNGYTGWINADYIAPVQWIAAGS
jgi:5S rRNA maturation endonuclease (ribonuclease M5)